jgi:hypothetical protein
MSYTAVSAGSTFKSTCFQSLANLGHDPFDVATADAVNHDDGVKHIVLCHSAEFDPREAIKRLNSIRLKV